MELFRKEAIEAAKTSELGKIRLSTPVSHTVVAASCVAVCIVILCWASFGTYTRRDHVQGSLVPANGLISPTANMQGVVASVQVSTGQKVDQGQVLIAITDNKSSQAYGGTSGIVSQDFRMEAKRIEDEISLETSLGNAQIESLTKQKIELSSQLKNLDEQRSITEHQYSDATELAIRIKSLLAKGYVSLIQYDNEISLARSYELQGKTIMNQQHELASQLSSTLSQLNQIPLSVEEKTSALKRQYLQIQQQLTINEGTRLSTIRSTISGTVTSVLVSNGQSVQESSVLLSIAPGNSPLRAQLLVPSASIAFVREGTSVALHYKAFPYQKFGLQLGRVSKVSRNALSPSEISSILGSSSPDEPMYLVDVELPDQFMMVYGERKTLSVGMIVDADILSDTRRIYEWILEPIYGLSRDHTR
jgi:membrane fusion protein